MRKSIVLFASVALLAVSLAAGAAEQCRYSAPRNAELDAAGLKRLSVEIGPDDLMIRGESGITKITVRGTACASSQEWLKDVKLETSRHGDTASIVARNGDHHVMVSLFGGSYAYLKLDVRVPQSMAVQLKEGSGDSDVAGVQSLEASVGSGDLKVNSVAGELGLSVGSGDVVASNVGSVNLSSVGSGDVKVDGVRGDAHAGSIGSGDLGLRDITGGVTVGSIASGDANLAGVGGSVEAKAVGSGDFTARNVKGNVSVGAVASGDVTADQVDRDFSVGSVGSGDIHHHGVKGKVSIPRTDD
jgi:hypothetical protein